MGFLVFDLFVRMAQARRGRNKCRYCARRLEAASGRFGFSDFCVRCRRSQPWADVPSNRESPDDEAASSMAATNMIVGRWSPRRGRRMQHGRR
jgi:hypothetical protein